MPGSILTLGAGFAFKQAYDSVGKALLIGVPAVWLGASIGAAISMLMGRFVFQEWVARKSANYPKAAAIQKAIE